MDRNSLIKNNRQLVWPIRTMNECECFIITHPSLNYSDTLSNNRPKIANIPACQRTIIQLHNASTISKHKHKLHPYNARRYPTPKINKTHTEKHRNTVICYLNRSEVQKIAFKPKNSIVSDKTQTTPRPHPIEPL